MRTFILEWNPNHSSVTEEDFLGAIPCLEWGTFWKGFREKPKARSGDNFFLLRTGTNTDGIVASGFFLSDPYITNSKGYSFRIDLRPTFMVSWENPKGLFSLDELKRYIGASPWDGTGNCTELPEHDSQLLYTLWEKYTSRFSEDDFEEDNTVARSSRPSAGIDDAILIAAEALYDIKSNDGRPAILQALKKGFAGGNDDEMISGILSEVFAFSELTAGKIREKGFSEAIIDMALQQNNPASRQA